MLPYTGPEREAIAEYRDQNLYMGQRTLASKICNDGRDWESALYGRHPLFLRTWASIYSALRRHDARNHITLTDGYLANQEAASAGV